MIQTPKVLNHCFDTTTPKVKWLFEHHYRDFLDFVTGAIYTVKKGTARFLETENQTEMLDLIRIRAMGDFIEEALVGSQKMENRKKIARLKKDIEVNGEGIGAGY